MIVTARRPFNERGQRTLRLVTDKCAHGQKKNSAGRCFARPDPSGNYWRQPPPRATSRCWSVFSLGKHKVVTKSEQGLKSQRLRLKLKASFDGNNDS
jgi:hypothetical protein